MVPHLRREDEMAGKGKAVPEGHHAITPHLVAKDAPKAIEFYTKAFGATELSRMAGPDGRLWHAMLQIGDSKLYLADEFCEHGAKSAQTLGGSPVTIHL